ncbi:hypothetical protein ISN44_As03g041630 [Arabidopsis suecica]|uniref:Uncharacterized protein n=1 Tax=Arabidopsis suecica TaxID=45249 RepID=A0A8T2FCR8_ARASU|nr:hypothetical protein ISN44_As03g041630 [Arabidopsis suecica]
METFGTIPPPPPLPPRPELRRQRAPPPPPPPPPLGPRIRLRLLPPPRQQLLRLRKQQPLLPEPLPLRPRAIPWLTGHDVKKGKSYDKLREYVENVRKQNEESERVLLPKSISYQDQNLENQQDTRSKPGINEVVEGSGTKRLEWVISIKDKLEQAYRNDDRTSWGKLCIYKVPHYLHGNDKKSYFPQTVSLGPYHHGRQQTQSMECHKWRAVNMVLKRTNQGIEVFLDAMIELEEKARACYEGSIVLSSNEFTEMLLLDGCFILELLQGVNEGFLKLGYDHNDPVFAVRGSMHSIQRDMIMLENQLPLFVLNPLLELQPGTQNQTGLVELVVRFFIPLMPTAETLTENSPPRGVSNGELHCLDVFHRSLLFPRSSGKANYSRVADKHLQRVIPTVTELRDAGFKFKLNKTDRFWDIKFSNGYLEIPGLLIHDGTKSLFLNLIAFEQCHIESSNDITSYIIFMDNLIDSPEDISYLHHCGIIEHSLGSNSEVADMFNQLCQEVVFDTKDIYLSQLLIEVHRCYKQNYSRKLNSLKTTLILKYLDNPWAYLSFFAAVILLILTFSQSYFAAYAYFNPSS